MAAYSNLGVDLRHKELTRAANLLLLGLYERAGDFIAENDALSVELYPWTPVGS